MSIYDKLDSLVLKVTMLSRTLICDSNELAEEEYNSIKTEVHEIKREINRLRNEELNNNEKSDLID